MFVPSFTVSQTEEDIIITIDAPHASLGSVEILVEENLFYFKALPNYHLELNIPGEVNQDTNSIRITADESKYIVRLEKDPVGEFFPDLDFQSKLLISSKLMKKSNFDGIKVIDYEPKFYSEDGEISWLSISQNSSNDLYEHNNISDNEILVTAPLFGFASRYSLDESFYNNNDFILALEIKSPELITEGIRTKKRKNQEIKKFSPEHYLADFDSDVPCLEFPWYLNTNPEFSKEHRHRMSILVNRNLPCLDDVETRKSVYFGFIDILLAFIYDYLLREGEENPESGWNISRLASSLSWLEIHKNLEDVLISFICRVLCYPLYRNWKFAKKIIKAVAIMLKSDNAKEWSLWCLLEARKLLISTPGFYVFANYFLDDYCFWIQVSANSSALKNIGEAMNKISLKKSMFSRDFHLIELESLVDESNSCSIHSNLDSKFSNLIIHD